MAETIDAGLRQTRERELPYPPPQAQVGHERQVLTRSQTRRSASYNSSPARSRQMTPDDQLLDSLREESEGPTSPPRLDDVSVASSSISWAVERSIHGNQALDGNGREDTRAFSSLAAKPRRPIPKRGAPPKRSALRDTIKEEPEELDISSVPASVEEPADVVGGMSTGRTAVEAIQAHVSATVEPTPPIIPDTTRDAPPVTAPTTPVSLNLARKYQPSPLTILAILLAIVTAFGTYTFGDKLVQIPHMIGSSPIFSGNTPHSGYNTSSLSGQSDAIHHLSSKFDRLGETFRGMSEDMADLKDDWSKKLSLINEIVTQVPPPPPPSVPVNPLDARPQQVNFCSIGLGAIVDPHLTTPTTPKNPTAAQRVYLYAAGLRHNTSPMNALMPWDGVGDCWCTDPKTKETPQLAILLGKPVVPEEVVIEHIPKGATLEPGAAPQDMELWVEYDLDSDEANSSSYLLRKTILDTLHEAYPGEPELAYSDDPILGDNFFRVGKWQYDPNEEYHVQIFSLDAVIDIPAARVEKVIFRATSNWGADYTCLYRVRLHGRL